MDSKILLILACTIALASAWSYYPMARRPMRFTRYAPAPPPHYRPHLHHHPLPQHRIPVPVESAEDEEPPQQRPKRGHDDYDHDHDHDHRGTSGVTGPVHTFVKTDKNANYKWGVRHHVGDKYAS